jgi:hypothetical protein
MGSADAGTGRPKWRHRKETKLRTVVMLEEAPVGNGVGRRNKRSILDPTNLNLDLDFAVLLGPVFCAFG